MQEVALVDEAGRADEVHSELDANRLQRVLIREPMLHQLIAVDEHDLSWQGNLP
jgi:hypothetical protein